MVEMFSSDHLPKQLQNPALPAPKVISNCAMSYVLLAVWGISRQRVVELTKGMWYAVIRSDTGCTLGWFHVAVYE